MKKLTNIFLGFIIGALATYFFCPRQADQFEEKTETDLKQKKPKGVISMAEAKKLNANWTKHRAPVLDSIVRTEGQKKDNRSFWWSLSDFENYIAFAKQQTGSLGYTLSGIRVYLGVYGKNAGQNKKELSTLFFVPTVSKDKNKELRGSDEEDCTSCDPLNAGHAGGELP